MITDTEELQDGHFYVCAGFERYKKMDYGQLQRAQIGDKFLTYKNYENNGRLDQIMHDRMIRNKPKFCSD